MRRRPDVIFLVSRRLFHLREEVKADTQNRRARWIEKLDDMFTLASSIALGEPNHQQAVGETGVVSSKQRQMWAHVAAHTAEVMGNLARGFDERQFNDDLAELERLVNEVKKLRVKKVGEGDRTGKPDCSEPDSEKVDNTG